MDEIKCRQGFETIALPDSMYPKLPRDKYGQYKTKALRNAWYFWHECWRMREQDVRQAQNLLTRGESMAREQIRLRDEKIDELTTELHAVIDDWNALVEAIGSPTHGGAVGRAKAMRDELAAYKAHAMPGASPCEG